MSLESLNRILTETDAKALRTTHDTDIANLYHTIGESFKTVTGGGGGAVRAFHNEGVIWRKLGFYTNAALAFMDAACLQIREGGAIQFAMCIFNDEVLPILTDSNQIAHAHQKIAAQLTLLNNSVYFPIAIEHFERAAAIFAITSPLKQSVALRAAERLLSNGEVC